MKMIGQAVLVTVGDAKTGPTEFRLDGDEAKRLKNWLAQHSAVGIVSQNEPRDTGYRNDD